MKKLAERFKLAYRGFRLDLPVARETVIQTEKHQLVHAVERGASHRDTERSPAERREYAANASALYQQPIFKQETDAYVEDLVYWMAQEMPLESDTIAYGRGMISGVLKLFERFGELDAEHRAHLSEKTVFDKYSTIPESEYNEEAA